MCSGPTINGSKHQLAGNGRLLVGNPIPKNPPQDPNLLQQVMNRARLLVDATEQAGGGTLRGLALPQITPTGVPQTKGFTGLIPIKKKP